MIVDEFGVEISDSARLNIAVPVFEIELLESEARWDDLVADQIWFQEHEAEMRKNVSLGITF
jgi:hypothetical protein